MLLAIKVYRVPAYIDLITPDYGGTHTFSQHSNKLAHFDDTIPATA
jgi:hypothetical protein